MTGNINEGLASELGTDAINIPQPWFSINFRIVDWIFWVESG